MNRRGETVRSMLLALVCMTVAFSAGAADEAAQPKYPPSFDCSAVPAGSQRQACNRSQLTPPMDAAPEQRRREPQGTVPSPDPQRLPTAKPPTIPSLPGTIDNRN